MKHASTVKIRNVDCVLRAAVSTIPPLPKLSHPTMTGMFTRPHQLRSTTFSRWLGLLLIALIFYGTTVEAAHRHGRVLPPQSNATSLDNSEHSPTPLSGKAACGDCLICQLHQNFNTTLIAFRVADPPAQPCVRTSSPLPRKVLSLITGPTSGRAPPAIS